MNNNINFNIKTNIYEEVESKIDVNIKREELPKRYFYSSRNIILADGINIPNNISNSMEHIYEEVNYGNEIKSSKCSSKKKISKAYQVIKNKITRKNSKVAKYEVQKQATTTNKNNKDYEYIYNSLNELSSKPKKHVKYDKFKKRIVIIKNKYFSKNKANSNETSLENVNCKFDNSGVSINNAIYNKDNIKVTSRLLDKGGYEVPICQQKHFLFSKDKKNITSIDNTDYKNSGKNKKSQATNLVKPSQVYQNFKASSVIDNQDEQTLNNLQGIVHKRITMFERNLYSK